MSALSTKLIAEYTELANQYLDRIPVKKLQDFQKITVALEALAKENTPPSQLKNRLAPIKELLDFPEDWVKAEDIPEFKSLICNRIAAKVKELASFTEEEKLLYIHQQHMRRINSTQGKKKVEEAAARTGNRAPNILSEEEWLDEMFRNLNPNLSVPAGIPGFSIRFVNAIPLSSAANLLFSLFFGVTGTPSNSMNFPSSESQQSAAPEYGPEEAPWMNPDWPNQLD
jgi:hypothetical protein